MLAVQEDIYDDASVITCRTPSPSVHALASHELNHDISAAIRSYDLDSFSLLRTTFWHAEVLDREIA